MGIEPTSEAWEAPVLPLNYARSLFRFYYELTLRTLVRRINWIRDVWHFYGKRVFRQVGRQRFNKFTVLCSKSTTCVWMTALSRAECPRSAPAVQLLCNHAKHETTQPFAGGSFGKCPHRCSA